MRGRYLAGFIFALASVIAWAAALPFAQSAPVAIAYNAPNPGVAANVSTNTSEQTFRSVALLTSIAGFDSPAGLTALRYEWRSFFNAGSTNSPADPTPIQLSTPKPQVDPTDAPDATPKPDPTPQPADEQDPTHAPDPTAPPTAKPTAYPTAKPSTSPTPKPIATATPKPIATATPNPTASPTPKPTASPTPKPTASPTTKPTASPTPKPTASPTPKPTASPTPKPTATPAPIKYSGSSHFWFPALNIDVPWGWYGCEYGGPDTLPGGVWRWGCGPKNNVYFLSHAWSTFKKLKVAYNNGTLKVGQNAWYADAQGDVTKFEIKWIRQVTVEYLNATAHEWALNDSPTQILTLQTCNGANDEYRLIVRLVQAN